MAQQAIKVRPTKIELIKLRRRLALSQRVQKIVREKLSILTLEFLQVARETVEAKRKVVAELSETYKALSIATGYHGEIPIEKALMASESDLKLVDSTRNIAGVIIPSLELPEVEKTVKEYNMVDTSSFLDCAAESSQKCLEAIVNLAESQRSLELLGMEINRTRRVVNALEYVVIPSLQITIKYMYMKFEERDREEKARLKRVKVLLERK